MRISWIIGAPLQQRPDGGYTSDLASLRYRVISPIQHLPAHRHAVFMITPQTEAPPWEAALDADMVIFSKTVTPSNAELARRAKARGAAVLFDICDNHFETAELAGHFREIAGLADQVVCNTPEMARVAAPFCVRPPVVIEDPYEGPRGRPGYAPGERLKVLWFGHFTNLDALQAVLDELAGWSETRPTALHILTTLNPRLEAVCASSTARYAPAYAMSCEQWTLAGQWRALAACDLVVIPSLPTPAKRVKSANRMVEALWAGRPVIAHPMPAYAPFAQWTPVGSSLTEGLRHLEDHALVERRIADAQAYIEAHHAPAILAQRWAQVLRAASTARAEPRPP